MDSSQFIWSIVFALGVAQGVIVCSVLLTSRGINKGAMRLLSYLIAGSALMIAEEFMEVSGLSSYLPHVQGSTMLLPLAMGPLVFLYSQFVVKDQHILRKKDSLHFIPFFVALIYFSPFYFQPATQKSTAIAEGIFLSNPSFIALTVFKGVHLFAYFFGAIYMLRSYQNNERTHAQDHKHHISWATRIMYAITVSMGIMYTLLILIFIGVEPVLNSDYFGSLVMALLIYSLGFVAIKYPLFLTGSELPASKPAPAPYQFSLLDDALKQQYLDSLLIYMQKEKPYTNPTVRLDDIADALSIPPNHLSQVINERLKINFNNFVNSYRVEDVKRKIDNPEHAHLTILALAYDAGFNSKTTFNRIFKRYTGTTPTRYRSRAVET